MSRSNRSLLPLALLVACHAPPTPGAAPTVAAMEAALVTSLAAARSPADATAPTAPEVLAIEPAVAELLKSAFRSHAERRRVMLENIANVHTPGYKKRVVITRTRAIRGANDAPVPIPVQLDAAPIFTTGTLEITERALDVAIDGEGFLAVLLTDGSTGYTRDGGLHLNADGKFVTAGGNVLLPEISIPMDTLEISIDPTGRVAGRTAGSPDSMTSFGQITLHRFINPAGLLPIDATTWRRTESSGQPVTGQPGLTGLGHLKQGFLERSNVSFEQELLNLQMLERQHQVLCRVLQQFGMIAP